MTAYSTTQVRALTGLTMRQVDHWIRSGLLGDNLRDLGSGNYRRFTDEDVAVLRAVEAFGKVIAGWGNGNLNQFSHFAPKIEEAVRRDGNIGWLIVTDEGAAVVTHLDLVDDLLWGSGGVVVALEDWSTGTQPRGT